MTNFEFRKVYIYWNVLVSLVKVAENLSPASVIGKSWEELGPSTQQQLIVLPPESRSAHLCIYSFVHTNPDPRIPGMARRIPSLLRTD